jgi:hypothetical protein
MDDQIARPIDADWQGPGLKTRKGAKCVAARPLGKPCRIGDEAWPQGQARVESAPRHIHARNQRLPRLTHGKVGKS